MSDSRERDDQRYANEPNEAGFSGGATTPQVVEDRGVEEAERVAVPGDDLTSAISDAVSSRGEREEEESPER
jgi:hypothetical protein